MDEGSEDTDPDLVARVAGGDRGAMSTLATRHEGAVFRYARSLTRDDPSAEDVMQQAFVDVLRGAHTYQATGSVRAWILSLTRNAAFRRARRRAGEPEQHVSLQELATLAGWGDDPEQLTARQLDRDRLRRAVQRLRGESREVVVLRDLEDLTGIETAEVLGITVAAVKSRLHRARLELVAILRQEVADAR